MQRTPTYSAIYSDLLHPDTGMISNQEGYHVIKLQDTKLFQQLAYIDGAWVSADSAATHDIRNPANGRVIATVADCGSAETRRAINAAEQALPAWRARTARQRATVLKRWYELIMTHQEDLAQLLTLEMGKPLAEARGEIAYGAAFVEWFAEEAKRIYGDVIPATQSDRRLVVIKQPIGVVAANNWGQ